MSFPFTPKAPSYPSPQRPFGDGYWRMNRSPNGLPGYGLQQSNGNFQAVTEKLNGFLGADRSSTSLPMYKDKPYFAPRRTGPRRHRGKITALGVVLFVLFLVWYSGRGGSGALDLMGFKPLHVPKGVDLWSWTQSFGGSPSSSSEKEGKKAKIYWDARRQRVKDAFIVSWDGYEEHAWGASLLSILFYHDFTI